MYRLHYYKKRDGIAQLVYALRIGKVKKRGSFPFRCKNFSFFPKGKTYCVAQPASYTTDNFWY